MLKAEQFSKEDLILVSNTRNIISAQKPDNSSYLLGVVTDISNVQLMVTVKSWMDTNGSLYQSLLNQLDQTQDPKQRPSWYKSYYLC